MRRRGRRLVAIGLGVVLALGVVGYAGAGLYVLESGTQAVAGCHPEHAGFTPAAFDATKVSTDFDTSRFDVSPYLMPDYQDVSFPSRDEAKVTIRAFWVPAARPDAPAVIVVHGWGACRRDPAILVPAGMLHRQGFGVLLIDMRDHGDSTVEDARYGAGSDEYRDVLGAWDWLIGRGLAPERIGVFAHSGGAPAAVVAMGEEPRLAAGWEESGVADMGTAVAEELRRMGFPEFLAPAASAWAVVFGDDFVSRSPTNEAKKIGTRPLQVVHGTNDRRCNVHHARDLEAALKAINPAAAEAWLIDGGEHVQGPFKLPAEYERRLGEFFHGALGA